jgi:hypothetical protein
MISKSAWQALVPMLFSALAAVYVDHIAELAQVNLSRAVFVILSEKLEQSFSALLQPQRVHRICKFIFVDCARAIIVKLLKASWIDVLLTAS